MRSMTVYRVLTVGLLCAIGAYRFQTMRKPADVTAYHLEIQKSVARVPRQIDGWIGQDAPPSAQAMMLLQPNVMVTRRYVNVETGQAVSFLLVHCDDAHDMAGHFPLRCYPAQDWKVQGAESRDWQVGELTVPGMEYRFSRSGSIGDGRGDAKLTVDNFLLRPGGKVLRDMDQMVAEIRGAGGEALGAAQVQVCFDGDVPADVRERTFKTLVRGFRPVIDAILADPAARRDGGGGGAVATVVK